MGLNIVCTALPWKEETTGKLMVSAHISFQAEIPSEQTLADFNDIRNWVAKLQKASFIVQVAGKPVNNKLRLERLDKTLYEQLFIPAIKIRPYQPEDLTVYPIRSYPVKHVVDFIQHVYTAVGNTKSDSLPTEKFFTDEWTDMLAISEYKIKEPPPANGRNQIREGDLITADQTARNRVKSALRSSKVFPFSKTPAPSFDFAQLRNFHDTSLDQRVKPAKLNKPEFEYHDILSVLSSYPQLQRKLGLVIDIELEGVVPDTGSIRVIPQKMDFEKPVKISSPATSFTKTTAGFYAKSKPDSIIDKGVLKLNDGDFTVVQVDADGTALKLCNQIDNLQQLKAKHLFYFAAAGHAGDAAAVSKFENHHERNEGLPAVRSSGLGIARNGLSNLVFTKFQKSNSLGNALLKIPAPVPDLKGANASFVLPPDSEALMADELVQGYRMDIAYEDKPTQWFSLHQRQDEYSFKPVSGQAVNINGIEPDEGFIQLAMTQQTTADKQLSIGEVIARWEGWSLSVVRPGKSLNNPGEGEKELSDNLKENEKYVLPGYVDFRLQAKSMLIKNKGTLPLLRFGKNYRIKIRTVDLAGNSLPFSKTPENETVSVMKNIRYRRYEPVPVPVLTLGNECRDGESMEHLVIRSNHDISAVNYEQSQQVNINGSTKKYPPVSTRHIRAPRAAQHFIETHGIFDAAFGPGNEAAAKEMYKYITDPQRDKVVNNPGDFTGAINFVIDPATKNYALDYMADPMAAGAVFVISGEFGDLAAWKKGDPRSFSFYFDDEVNDVNVNTAYGVKEWMYPKSLRICLAEGDSAEARWEKTNGERKFTIYLPKGKQLVLNYASFWRPDDVKKISGMHELLFNSPSANATARNHAIKGQHWMFSPWRQVRLTHAVQQPMMDPSLKAITPVRKYDDTTAELHSLVRVNGSSTDKVDMTAKWKEYKDDLAELGPDVTDASAQVEGIQVDYNDATLVNGKPIINGAVYSPSGQPSENVRAALIHRFNDTKHRNINYQPIATTRYREYFTRLIAEAAKAGTAFPLTRIGNELAVNILSTSRPVAPQVEYVLPSFNWLKNTSGNTTTHMRTGNVRVYLKRPWFSSGEGERIALILSGNKNFNAEMAKYCTIWGKDPLFYGGELNSSNFPTPDKTTFPFGAEYEVSLTIAEAPGVKVAAVGYNVIYDQERQLYYADIPIGINQAYFPFIKLALARYQKDSLRLNEKDCCLSNIVHTDWIQIVPPRTTLVNQDSGAKNKVNVAVAGTSGYVGINNPTVASKDEIRTKLKIVVEQAKVPKSEEAFVRLQGNRFETSVIFSKEFVLTTADLDLATRQIKFKTSFEFPEAYKDKPVRLVIEEYELHLADPLRQPGGNGVFESQPEKWQERLVFVDVFELNGSV